MRKEFHAWLHDNARDIGLPASIFIHVGMLSDDAEWYDHDILDALWCLWQYKFKSRKK